MTAENSFIKGGDLTDDAALDYLHENFYKGIDMTEEKTDTIYIVRATRVRLLSHEHTQSVEPGDMFVIGKEIIAKEALKLFQCGKAKACIGEKGEAEAKKLKEDYLKSFEPVADKVTVDLAAKLAAAEKRNDELEDRMVRLEKMLKK